MPAAQTMGSSRRRIMLRHLVPNAVGVIVVNATFTVADAVFIYSALSFLGLGLPPWHGSRYVTAASGRAGCGPDPSTDNTGRTASVTGLSATSTTSSSATIAGHQADARRLTAAGWDIAL